jgi:hypothetical protein
MELMFPFLIIVLILMYTGCGFGQNYSLVLKGKTTGVERTIHEGSRISIKRSDGSYVKGTLSIISNSEIMISQSKIELNDISIISSKSASSNITGGALIGSGGLLITLGIIAISTASTQTNKSNFNALPVIGVIVVGGLIVPYGITHIIKGKRYKKEIWEYRIKDR